MSTFLRPRRGPLGPLSSLAVSALRLLRQIPYTFAADLLLTGRHLKAPEDKALGLIGHVVPDGSALDKAHEIVTTSQPTARWQCRPC